MVIILTAVLYNVVPRHLRLNILMAALIVCCTQAFTFEHSHGSNDIILCAGIYVGVRHAAERRRTPAPVAGSKHHESCARFPPGVAPSSSDVATQESRRYDSR